jgi:hypothetical protein
MRREQFVWRLIDGKAKYVHYMSVLASLSKRMEHFTLGSVLAEINRWIETGQSIFREELASIQAVTTAPSKLPP